MGVRGDLLENIALAREHREGMHVLRGHDHVKASVSIHIGEQRHVQVRRTESMRAVAALTGNKP